MTTLPTPCAPASDDACYRAVKARDARFDGSFFTAVTSTGIYCRPVCKVKAPQRENCRFFGHAAQAEAAGFRPCMRCRPELAPNALIWSTQDASHTLALQAAHMLDDALAHHMPHLDSVAKRLGVSDRHLRRIFEAHIGVSPLQYLQTRRLLCAKQLLTDTRMAVADVAQASGFASLRRFHAAFAQHYRLNPTQLRREGAHTPARAQHATRVRLGYRPPYDVAAMLQFLQTRQLNAIESIAAYACQSSAKSLKLFKTMRCMHHQTVLTGWVSAQFDEAQCTVEIELSDSLHPALPVVIARLRAMLDLDADPQAIDAVLGAHFPDMQGTCLPAAQAGIRVPGCLDGFELAVRAVLGQQVTVAAGRTFAQRVVDRFGEPIATPFAALTRLFPAPKAIAHLPPSALGELGIVKQRQAALIALAQAVDSGALDLNSYANALQTVEFLKTLPGIGDWTAQYIAMRALRWPDAFAAGDVALHRALGLRDAKNPAKAAEAASQVWRPWRSYAMLRAWQGLKQP